MKGIEMLPPNGKQLSISGTVCSRLFQKYVPLARIDIIKLDFKGWKSALTVIPAASS